MAKENKGKNPQDTVSSSAQGNQSVYNINYMRAAFAHMHDTGNRGVITKKVCTDLGISTTYFDWYKESLKNLFEVVATYCRLKNSPTAAAADVNAAYEAIFPVWKEMLSTAEADKFTRELRVTEHDISNLVSFCQTFVNDANDASLGRDEGFVAHKVWSVQTAKDFQKRVETDIGIRIAQVEVLSDAERDFLKAERKILSKWRKAEGRISDINAEIEKLNSLMAKAKGDEVKDLLNGQIGGLKKALKEQEDKIEKCRKAYDQLQDSANEPADAAPAPADEGKADDANADAAKAETKKPRRTRRSSAKSASPERPTEDAVMLVERETAAA